ncbi:class I SAM-dependent methyltransferase [Chloroflexota bacterium]
MIEEINLETDKDRIRERLVKYTRRAFHLLPELHKPYILDIGCGSGVPTIELAKLSDGQIIGLDTDSKALTIFRNKVDKYGLSERIKVIEQSMLDMDFPDESFDIIWAEGSISGIGFKNGLEQWQRFIKPKGFIVVHDEVGDIDDKINQVSNCGYDLLDYFILGKDVWWNEYFALLEKLIIKTRTKYKNNPAVIRLINTDEKYIDMFRANPEQYCSVYFIMKRK